MNRSYLLCLILIAVVSPINADLLDYNDSQIHNISSDLDGPFARRVDYDNSGPPTTVNILPESTVFTFQVYNNGILNLLGGTASSSLWGFGSGHINVKSGYVKNSIQARGNSILTISGGSVKDAIVSVENAKCFFSNGTTRRIMTYHNSQFTVSSGLITGACRTYDESLLSIHGGIFQDLFQIMDTSTIALYGSDFSIDGSPLKPGMYYSTDFKSGQLTGVLENGDILNVNFSFFGDARSSLIIIPEPCTLLLLVLGVGGVMIRRK